MIRRTFLKLLGLAPAAPAKAAEATVAASYKCRNCRDRYIPVGFHREGDGFLDLGGYCYATFNCPMCHNAEHRAEMTDLSESERVAVVPLLFRK